MEILKLIKADVEVVNEVVKIKTDKTSENMLKSNKNLIGKIKSFYNVGKIKFEDSNAKKDIKTLRVKIVGFENQCCIKEINELIDENDYVSVDFETSSLDTSTLDIIGIGLRFEKSDLTYYIPTAHNNYSNCPTEVAIELLKLLSNNLDFLVWNKGFEGRILKRFGVRANIIDGMIYNYQMADLKTNKLKQVAEKRLNVYMKDFKDLSSGCFADLSVEEASQYCGSDVYYTSKIYESVKAASNNQLIDLDHKTSDVLIGMEDNKIKIDKDKLTRIRDIADKWSQKYKQTIENFLGYEINLNSPKQVSKALYEDLKIVPEERFRNKSGFSSGADAIKSLVARGEKNPMLDLLGKYRNMIKIKSTYCNKILSGLDNNDRFKTYFNYTRTSTGRISSDFQQIPKSGLGGMVRSCVIPDEGMVLVAADYSQVEIRVLAHLMGDENLIKLINSGEDIHKSMASILFNKDVSDVTNSDRRKSKTLTFSVIYGSSYKSLSESLNVSHKEAKELIEAYYKTFSKLKEYKDTVLDLARSSKEIKTITGRVRRFPEIHSNNVFKRLSSEREAFNTVIQGPASDINKKALIESNKLCSKYGARLILTVHDEIVVEVPRNLVDKFVSDLKEVLSFNNLLDINFDVNLEVDIGVGNNYMEAK